MIEFVGTRFSYKKNYEGNDKLYIKGNFKDLYNKKTNTLDEHSSVIIFGLNIDSIEKNCIICNLPAGWDNEEFWYVLEITEENECSYLNNDALKKLLNVYESIKDELEVLFYKAKWHNDNFDSITAINSKEAIEA